MSSASSNPLTPAQRLAQFMQARGLTQAQVGRALGYTRQHINQIIHGSENLSEACIEKLREVYALSREWLLEGEGDPFGGATTTETGRTITAAGPEPSIVPPKRQGARPIVLCPGCHQSLPLGAPECPQCGLALDWPDLWEDRYR